MKAAHSLCTATVSTVNIKEQLTDSSVKLTALSRVLLEKMTGSQLVKYCNVTVTEVSLPHSEQPVTCTYYEPVQSNPSPIPLLDDPF